ncbi:hypothetical protein GCM10019059_39770 [Camelimonas fluminis]|nr:hypothetical protein GCM10019059_39770 [Camelimonas fluminis]
MRSRFVDTGLVSELGFWCVCGTLRAGRIGGHEPVWLPALRLGFQCGGGGQTKLQGVNQRS